MGLADVCVVGGGLAGLSAAYHLYNLGLKPVVAEALDSVGGLLRSMYVGGFTFDTGGSHIIFSRSREVLNSILKILSGNYVRLRRNSKIYYKGLYIKYPFENGLKDLPPQERYECLRDLIETYVGRVRGAIPKPRNFLEWIYYVFGRSIAEKYLVPYNTKIWKVDLEEISLEWVKGRVPNPPIDEVIKAAVGIDVEGYRHQLTFYYPIKGGIQELAYSLRRFLNVNNVAVLVGEPVRYLSIDRSGYKRVCTESRELMCRAVVFTASLKRSSSILSEVLGDLSKSLERLRSVPLAVVGLGVRGEPLPYHWIYFPNPDLIFHRVAYLSNYSRLNAPKNAYTLIAEVSFKDEGELFTSSYRVLRRVVEGLEEVGILKGSEVEVSEVWLWRDAYVIYDSIRSGIVNRVREKLERVGVFMLGRFGEWEYLNMDAVFSRARDTALKVLSYLNKLPGNRY